MDRKSLPNSVRFEVFKRDKFTCQYCGGKAPDVILNADHIRPVADGGTDNLMNLVTSCFTCNNGKGARLLADDSAVTAARTQAEVMEERRQQVRMMAEWQVELARMDVETQAIDEAFRTITKRVLTETGTRELRRLARRYGLQQVIKSIAIAYDEYEEEHAFGKIGGICHNLHLEEHDPEQREANRVFYQLRARGLIQNSFTNRCRSLILRRMREGWPPAELLRVIDEANGRSWWDIFNILESLTPETNDDEPDPKR